ncbi:hypothetical protein [Catalinimonas niigatensis]|uniref:hypothetical protein n=1 Tax=Catalinimonas niigatensis TaxID=1397264 RepID=UPI0026661DA4|nr:hypothetical protein [Catalinimonas niigatensis]WPP49944.1 hypothetical protein PZB72_25100 [Catalinimonas niigatensis]
MYRLLFLICIYFYGNHFSFSQGNERFRIGSDEEIEKAIPANERYRFENFRQGEVLFQNGTQANARLNYNLLIEEMQFVDITGDTMSLADEHLIKRIKLGENIFYYDEKSGFVEVIGDYTPVKLSIHQKFTTVNAEKMGAYGQSSAVSSIKTYSSYSTSNGQRQNLKLKGDVVLAIESIFYLVDQNNRIYKANKSAIRKIFPEQKQAIQEYVKQEAIDFNDEEDLKKLLQYSSEISS